MIVFRWRGPASLLTVTAAFLVLCLALFPARAWPLNRGRLPNGTALIAVGVLAASIVASLRLPTRWRPALVALVAGTVYFSGSTVPLGDRTQWLDQLRSRQVFVSEPLAQLTYSAAFRAGLDYGVIPVLVGLASAALYLRLGLAIRQSETTADWLVVGSTFLATAVHLVFFRGSIENPPLSLPFAILFVSAAWRSFQEGNRDVGWPRFTGTAALGAVAALFHGQCLFLLPAWWLSLSMRDGRRMSAMERAKWVVAAIGMQGIFFVGGLALISAFGYRVASGNALGGGDAAMFVPLSSTGGFATFSFFSWAHFVRVANIALVGAPLFFVAAAMSAGRRAAAERPQPFLSLIALAYLFFVTLWNFDLAFPGDFDLMLSLSPLLGLWVCEATRGIHLSWLAMVTGVAAVAVSWSVVEPFLR